MRKWQFWVGLIVSLFFFVWAFRQVDSFGGVLDAMRSADYTFVVPAIALYFIGVWFRGLRWGYLLAPLKQLSSTKLFRLTVIGYMANDVLPARMGEFVRAYILSEKEGISKSSSLATIFIERLFDGITLLTIAVIVSLVYPFVEGLQEIVRVTALVFGVAILAFFGVAASPDTANRLVSFGLRILPHKLRPSLARIAASFIEGLRVLQTGSILLRVFVLSCAAWFCEAGMYYLLGVGFKVLQPVHAFLLTMVVTNVGTMVPSSPGYVGTFEALSVFTLGLFNVSADLAMSYTLVLHVVLLVPVTLVGFYFLWQDHISLAMIGKSPVAKNAALGEERLG
jgi:uncharacterized protein (TIRG00374 family)